MCINYIIHIFSGFKAKLNNLRFTIYQVRLGEFTFLIRKSSLIVNRHSKIVNFFSSRAFPQKGNIDILNPVSNKTKNARHVNV